MVGNLPIKLTVGSIQESYICEKDTSEIAYKGKPHKCEFCEKARIEYLSDKSEHIQGQTIQM